MIIVIMGAPGAGKGTQGDLLAVKRRFRKLSTGDALRAHVKAGTEIGKEAEAIMNSGHLVSDNILFRLVKDECEKVKDQVLLLDGFPRTLNQAKMLQSYRDIKPVRGVFFLKVDKNELVERLSGRRSCSACGSVYHVRRRPSKKEGICDQCQGKLVAREDDQANKVATRFDVFDKQTKPILGYYEALGLCYEIEGTGEAEDVFRRLDDKVMDVVKDR